jgi:hypothetical protein
MFLGRGGGGSSDCRSPARPHSVYVRSPTTLLLRLAAGMVNKIYFPFTVSVTIHSTERGLRARNIISGSKKHMGEWSPEPEVQRSAARNPESYTYTRDTIIGSLGSNVLTDPFTDGVETMPNRHTISAPVGANRKAGMICDNTTSKCKNLVRTARYEYRYHGFSYSFQAVKI